LIEINDSISCLGLIIAARIFLELFSPARKSSEPVRASPFGPRAARQPAKD